MAVTSSTKKARPVSDTLAGLSWNRRSYRIWLLLIGSPLPFDGFVDLLDGLECGVNGGVAGVDVLHLHADLVV